MYFSAKTVVEFFCGFHVCHMEAVEFFGKHADKGVGAEEADRFFFYPIFICIGIAFFNGIQPVSFFCVVYSADSVEKKKEILYFLRFFPAAVVPAFPVEKRNFSAGAAQDIPRRRTAVDDIRIVECGKRRAYAVEKILFSSKVKLGSSIQSSIVGPPSRVTMYSDVRTSICGTSPGHAFAAMAIRATSKRNSVSGGCFTSRFLLLLYFLLIQKMVSSILNRIFF